MSTVYFDKGAFSQLWRSSAFSDRERLRLRRRLCLSLSARRPQVILGPTTLTELAGAPADLRERELELLLRLPDSRYLTPMRARVQEDVAAAYDGRAPEPFLLRGQGLAILRAARVERELLQMERAQFEADRAAFVDGDTRLRVAALRDAGSRQELVRWVGEFLRRPDEYVSRSAEKLMTKHRAEFGLQGSKANWPDPRTLPTVWGFISYQFARMCLVIRDGWRLDANDEADWRHYAAAMYADVIITDDRKLRQILAASPAPKPASCSFDEWGRSVLSVSSG